MSAPLEICPMCRGAAKPGSDYCQICGDYVRRVRTRKVTGEAARQRTSEAMARLGHLSAAEEEEVDAGRLGF